MTDEPVTSAQGEEGVRVNPDPGRGEAALGRARPNMIF